MVSGAAGSRMRGRDARLPGDGGVLVTGASSGIGRELALDLARRGCVVYGGVRSVRDADRLRRDTEGRARPLLMDVRDGAALRAAARALREESPGRGLAALVNCAGIVVPGPIAQIPSARLREQLDVNVVGAHAVVRAFLPALRLARGRVLHIGSMSASLTLPFMGPYSASKAALRALSRAQRMELAPFGVRVVHVELGNVRTPLWKRGREALGPQVGAGYDVPLARFASLSARAESSALEPERIVRALRDVLAAPRPRESYVLGADARAARLFAALPGRLRERILSTLFGLREIAEPAAARRGG